LPFSPASRRRVFLLPPTPGSQLRRPVTAAASVVVQAREVDLAFPVEATVEAVRQATVAAQVPGRVLEVRADAGDAVKQGQLLMRIDAREAAEGYAASQATLAQRESQLRAHEESARAEVHQQGRARQGRGRLQGGARRGRRAGAGRQPRQHRLAADGLRRPAPHRGRRDGHPGKPLITVYDPKGLRVTASIRSTSWPNCALTCAPRSNSPRTGKWIDAAKVEILPTADPRTHTVTARLYLPDNQPGMVPGMFARAHFVTGKAKKLLVPPRPCCAGAR
jgi:multidrug efflux pump subunit AcrA (membrane-fusion protein)